MQEVFSSAAEARSTAERVAAKRAHLQTDDEVLESRLFLKPIRRYNVLDARKEDTAMKMLLPTDGSSYSEGAAGLPAAFSITSKIYSCQPYVLSQIPI